MFLLTQVGLETQTMGGGGGGGGGGSVIGNFAVQ